MQIIISIITVALVDWLFIPNREHLKLRDEIQFRHPRWLESLGGPQLLVDLVRCRVRVVTCS